MNAELYRKLRDMSHENAMACQLVRLWETGVLTYEEWSVKAITALIEQNDIVFKAAVDAERRAYPKPMVLDAAPTKEDGQRYPGADQYHHTP